MVKTLGASDNALQCHQLCLQELAVWQSLQTPTGNFGKAHMGGVEAATHHVTDGSSGSRPLV